MGSPSILLTPLFELADSYGAHLATSPDAETWVSVTHGGVTLRRGRSISASFELAHCHRPHFSSDGKRLFVGVPVIDVESARPLDPLDVRPNLIAGISPDDNPKATLFSIVGAMWSPDGSRLVVHTKYRPPRGLGRSRTYSGPLQRTLLLDGATGEHICTLFEGRQGEYTAIAINAYYIAAGYVDIRVWNFADCQSIAELNGHQFRVTDTEFSPDGNLLASVSRDNHIYLWDTLTWEPAACWEAHEGGVAAVKFHPTLPLLATGGWDHHLRVWSLANPGECLTSVAMSGPVEGIAFSPSGEKLYLASGGLNARLVIYATASQC